MGEIIDVNELLKQNKKFYKFTNYKENHFGLQYCDGEIIDPKPFNPSGECLEGGMYFFEQSQLLLYGGYVASAWWIREVILLPTSRVYKEKDKYKTDRFVLKERTRFYGDLSEYITQKMCVECVKSDALMIQLIPGNLINEEMCLESVRQDGMILGFLPSSVINEKICIEALIENKYAYQYIPSRIKHYALKTVTNDEILKLITTLRKNIK